MASGDTKTQQYLDIAANGTRADLPSDNCCNTRTQNLIVGVAERIMDVEDEVEELKNNPDVVDIVDTYQDLEDYDTSTLTDKDIVRVLSDSTHSDNSTYYRWNAATSEFDFVGEISGGGSGPTVVQTTGTSTTDVMSQNATTSLVYADPGTNTKIKIGDHTSESEGNNGIEIGHYSQATGTQAIAIGGGNSSFQAAKADSIRGIAIGAANCTAQDGISIGNSSGSGAGIGSIAIGSGANTGGGAGCVSIGPSSSSGVVDTKGVVSIGFINPGEVSRYGYNNSRHRLLTGVYDGQGIHDAATVAQGNTLATSAPTTSTVGVLGQLYTDTTTMHTYQCTDTTGGVYTWTQRW